MAFILYWPTLSLPVIYDDLLHIRITKGLTFLNVWWPTEAFGFYRPLTFVPLLLVKRIWGFYPAGVLHALNILQHALNCLLLSALVWRISRKTEQALLAGLLCAVYPFSYQAIAVYGHNVHPTTTGLILLGLHTYLWGIKTSSWRWWGSTVALFILGLLSHESAILFGPFAFLIHWAYGSVFPLRGVTFLKDSTSWSDQLRNLTFWRSVISAKWFVFSVLGVLYFVGYQFLPLSRAPQADVVGGAVWAKVLYLLQGISFPLAWLGQFVPDGAKTAVVWLGVAVVIGLVGWRWREEKETRPGLILALGWWTLASLVIAIPLTANYLLHGPRLLYLSSIGTTLLWSFLLTPHTARSTPHVPRLFALFILITSSLFVSNRLRAYADLTSPVAVVADEMATRPEDEGILLINLPQWTAPAANTYPIGVELVAQLGDYLFVEELMVENLGVDRPVQATVVPELLSNPNGYTYDTHNQANLDVIEADWNPAGSHIFITHYQDSGLQTTYTGSLRPYPSPTGPIAYFGGYNLIHAKAEQCAGLISLTTHWQQAILENSQYGLRPTTSLFVQLLAPEGQVIAQADNPPLNLRADLIDISPLWELVDERVLDPAGATPAHIIVGVYDFATGERYPGRDSQQTTLPNYAYTVPLTPCEG